MELRQLAYFIAVAEDRNFTRAARRLKVAQPAVSQQVLRLERELGETLLLRTPRGVELSDAGRAFLPHARASLAAATAGREALISRRGLLSGRLAVGTVRPAPAGLTSLLSHYVKEHPGVELRVRDGHTRDLIAGLSARELDVAIIGLDSQQPVPDGVQHEVISTEPVVLVVHRQHRLAGRRSVTVSQLRAESMVTLPEGSGQRLMIEAAARTAGFQPQITAESSDLTMLLDLAAQAVGVALLPSSAARPSDQLAVVEISRPRLIRRTLLCWHEQTLAPAARAFLAQARAHLLQPGGKACPRALQGNT